MRTRIAISALMVLAGCLSTAARVIVVPSGSGVSAPAKAAGCSLTVLRTPPRDQPYDELASLHYTTDQGWSGDPAAAQNAIREQACALGADAVLVIQEFMPGVSASSGSLGKSPTMAGLAIRFRPTAAVTTAGGATAP
jgi:hypothetical protein